MEQRSPRSNRVIQFRNFIFIKTRSPLLGKTLAFSFYGTRLALTGQNFAQNHFDNMKMPSDDSKSTKKEEIEDEDEINLGSLKKKKPNIATPTRAKAKKVKKEEADDDFEQPSSKKSANKPSDKVLKKKKKEEDEKKMKKKGAKEPVKTANKREKKVYDLPGQKRDPPEERDPLRIFYETLYEQVPNSEMAAIWMMESGMLPKEVAKKVYEKKQKKAQQQKLQTPMKASVTVKRKADSVTIKKKTSSFPVSTQKKKTPDSKVVAKQTKKRKTAESSSEDGSDDDDDVVLAAKRAKKPRAA